MYNIGNLDPRIQKPTNYPLPEIRENEMEQPLGFTGWMEEGNITLQ